MLVWVLGVFVALISALLTVTCFLRDFYELRTHREALLWLANFLIPRLFTLPIFRAAVRTISIRGGEIANPEGAVARIGGRGLAAISEDSAAVFEQYGRITQVLGPGYHPLRPYERVRGTVDLRPHTIGVQVRGFTRDGIPLQGEIEIEYQIRQLTQVRPEGPSQPDQQVRRFRSFYTFSWEGVLRAVHNTPVREGLPMRPGDVIGGEVSYQFHRVVENYRLNELLAYYPEATLERERGLVSRDAMRLLEGELYNALRAPLRNWGYQINRLQINALDVSDEVRERVRTKLFALWRSFRLAKLRAEEARIEASAFRIRSEARANAEAQFIEALVSEISRLGRTSLDRQLILAVACVNVLDNFLSSIQRESQLLIPTWILDQIDRLKKILALP